MDDTWKERLVLLGLLAIALIGLGVGLAIMGGIYVLAVWGVLTVMI